MEPRFRSAGILVALAAICVAIVLIRQPTHGLYLTRFSDRAFTHPVSQLEVDRHVYFAPGEFGHRIPDWVKPNTSARWIGFVEIPRESEYTFQLTSDDGGWLYIDDTLRVDLKGEHEPKTESSTFRLTRGFHPIRIDYFQASGDATLKVLWQRSGNNAEPGLLPVSMLYPITPLPIGLMDRVLRLLPWLFLFAAAWLARGRLFPPHAEGIRTRAYAWATVLFVFALALRLNGLGDEGETCDEWTYVSAGYAYAQNIVAHNFDPDQWGWNYEHPNVAKLIYGAAQFVFGTAPLVAKATACVFSALTVLILFWIGVRLFGLATGIAAALVLALMPSFIAHGRVAALDTPATFFAVATMALLIRSLHDSRRVGYSQLGLVVVTGLGLGSKFTNGLLIPLLLAALVLPHWRSLTRLPWPRIPWALTYFPLTTFIPVIATWPWLWSSDPVDRLNRTHQHWQFAPYDLFFGRVVEPPIGYFAAAFACIAPLALFAPFLLAVAQVFRRKDGGFVIPGDGYLQNPRAWWALLIGWFVVPFAWSFTTFRMSNIKYVYNAFPPFALLAGCGLVIAGRWIGGRVAAARPGFGWAGPALTVTAATAYLIAADVGVHPYYLDYFNEAVGGPKGVFENKTFQFGWWGEGIDPGVTWVNEHAAKGASFTIGAWSPPGVTAQRSDLKRTDTNPDYIVSQWFATTPPGPDYTLDHEIGIRGAPIVRVYKRAPPKSAPTVAIPK